MCFQLVDLRWGEREEWFDNSLERDLFLKEISDCQNLSAGPCFVVGIVLHQVYRCYTQAELLCQCDARGGEGMLRKGRGREGREGRGREGRGRRISP